MSPSRRFWKKTSCYSLVVSQPSLLACKHLRRTNKAEVQPNQQFPDSCHQGIERWFARELLELRISS
ncbi:unnamed protein product [Musa textilis]